MPKLTKAQKARVRKQAKPWTMIIPEGTFRKFSRD